MLMGCVSGHTEVYVIEGSTRVQISVVVPFV